MLHCIGDSHASIFSGSEVMQHTWPQRSNDSIPGIRSYRIGAATAYNLKNKKETIDEILNSVLRNEDLAMFCFGEVDCRAHLKKQMDLQSRCLDDIVEECVDRYFSVIMYYYLQGVSVAVWGPVASHGIENPYTTGPSFGTPEERNKITEKFNVYLKFLCSEKCIPFATAFYAMTEDSGEGARKTNVFYTDSVGIHLNQNSVMMVLDILEEEGII